MCFSTEVDTNIKNLSRRFNAVVDQQAYQRFNSLMAIQKSEFGPEKIKEIFNQKRKSKQFVQVPGDDGRIYPNYFAPVIVMENGVRKIKPMRYRVRPQGSDHEIPSQYNVFNARLDALEKRKTWEKLFGQKHGLFPFKSFYEWIEDSAGSKKLINFIPDHKDLMWAPCLYDTWTSKNNEITIDSFALITDEPPREVLQMGHDRCPIFLLEKHIDSWLDPVDRSFEQLYGILKDKEDVYYQHQWAA